jgi:hypothetical protein
MLSMRTRGRGVNTHSLTLSGPLTHLSYSVLAANGLLVLCVLVTPQRELSHLHSCSLIGQSPTLQLPALHLLVYMLISALRFPVHCRARSTPL